MDPEIEDSSNTTKSPSEDIIPKKEALEGEDEDGLNDDIEDKNASYSDYSVSKV
jgi:hypothetical protein